MTKTRTDVSLKATYTVREMADILGISLPTAYELCNREDFPAIRVTPRRIIIPVDGLQRWLEEQSSGGKKELRRSGSAQKSTERENMGGIILTAEQNTMCTWEARLCQDFYGQMPDNIPDSFDTIVATLVEAILSPQEKRVIDLYCKDGCTQADIARNLGISRQRVNELFSKCKHKFRAPRIKNILGFEASELSDTGNREAHERDYIYHRGTGRGDQRGPGEELSH